MKRRIGSRPIYDHCTEGCAAASDGSAYCVRPYPTPCHAQGIACSAPRNCSHFTLGTVKGAYMNALLVRKRGDVVDRLLGCQA